MESSIDKPHEVSTYRKTIEWNSDSEIVSFEEFANRFLSEILQKRVTLKVGENLMKFNVGVSIVYFIHLKFGGNTKNHGATLTREVDPDMVSSPIHKVKNKIREAFRLQSIPEEYYETISALEAISKFDGITKVELKPSGESQAYSTKELESIRSDLQIDLDRCIKSEFSWILESQYATLLLGRETWMIEPNNVSKFTTAEEDLNTELFLQLQTGTITGQARRCFHGATHGSFLQTWSDLYQEFGNKNMRQKFKTVTALFTLKRKGKELAKFKHELLTTCSTLVDANVTLVDLMKYAVLEALDANDSMKVLQSTRMIDRPDESVLDFVNSCFNTIDLAEGATSGT